MCHYVIVLQGQEGEVSNVVFSPNSQLLAAGSGMTVCVWDVASGECRATLQVRYPGCMQAGRDVPCLVGV